VYSVLAVLLGLGFAYAVLRPGVIRDAGQMNAVRTDGLYGAFALVAGAVAVQWVWRRKRALATVVATAASGTVLLLTLAHAQDEIARPGTRDLAATFQSLAAPGDRVYHYGEYFHDFSFYAQSEVGLVGAVGELEVAIDPAARRSGRFIDKAQFLREWTAGGRVWAVARKTKAGELFADPSFRYYLLDQSRSHTLFSNQP